MTEEIKQERREAKKHSFTKKEIELFRIIMLKYSIDDLVTINSRILHGRKMEEMVYKDKNLKFMNEANYYMLLLTKLKKKFSRAKILNYKLSEIKKLANELELLLGKGREDKVCNKCNENYRWNWDVCYKSCEGQVLYKWNIKEEKWEVIDRVETVDIRRW